MLSAVLRSKIAIYVSIRIMDAFVAMRRFVSDHAGLVQRVGAIELKQLETDKRIDTVFDALDRGNLLPSGILPAESEFDSTTSMTDSSLSTTLSCMALARPSTASAVASLPTPPAMRRRSPSCWQWCHERGPAVALAGFGCAFLVTLLDALCTGQVYVPVLALISREPGAWRSFALLALYNLAFVSPLVVVFVLASKTTDAFQMAKWSSRNVIPAKIALGVMFAILGAMLLLVA